MERYLLLVKFSWILNGKAKKQHPLNHQARALCDMMRSILGRKTSYKMLEGNIFYANAADMKLMMIHADNSFRSTLNREGKKLCCGDMLISILSKRD